MTSTSYVYFIQAASGGPIKIGVSIDPPKRLLELQPGNPEELRIIGVIPGVGRRFESELHAKFRDSRLCGEWFEPSDPLHAFMRAQALRWSARHLSPQWVLVSPSRDDWYWPVDGDGIFTLAEVAQMTGWSERLIRRGCIDGRYGYARCGERLGMVRQHVDDLIAAHEVPARVPASP